MFRRPSSGDAQLPSLASTPPTSARRLSSAQMKSIALRSPSAATTVPLPAPPKTPSKMASFHRPANLLVSSLTQRSKRQSIGSDEAAWSKRLPATPQTARRRSLAGDILSSGSPATPSAAQYIVDKPPKHMRMGMGDHYYIPMRVTALRVDVHHESPDLVNVMAPPMIEVIGVLTSSSSRRIGFISASSSSRDKAVGVEPMTPSIGSRGESVILNLALINPDAQFLMLVVAPCNGKNLRDVEKVTFHISDIGFFPGNPELCSYEYFTPPTKTTGAITLIFCRDKPLVSSAPAPPPAPVVPPAKGSKEEKSQSQPRGETPKETPSQLWTIKALGQALLQTKPSRHVHPGCEDLAKHMQQGWLPVPKGVHNSGGDPSRILSDRMTRKAQQRTQQAAKSNAERSPGTVDEDAFFATAGGGNELLRQSTMTAELMDSDFPSRDRRESVDTATPVDQLEMDMEELYLMIRAPTQGRPRVVRRHRCLYSVGRGARTKQHSRHSSSSEEEESDDEELFRQVFTNFASGRVTRYDNRCYNVGTDKDALLRLYLAHKEQFDAAMNQNAQPRAPLIVDRVFTDKDPDDVVNIFANPPSIRSRGESPANCFDNEVASYMGPQSVLDPHTHVLTPYRSDDLLTPSTTDGGGRGPTPLSGRTFGALKPVPPSDVRALRDNQERQRREHQQQQQQQDSHRQIVDKAEHNEASSEAERDGKKGKKKPQPTTFKAFRNIAAVQRTPRAGSVSPKSRRTSPKPKKKPNAQSGGMFNGQLLQWIDAFMKQQKPGPSLSSTMTSERRTSAAEDRRGSIPGMSNSAAMGTMPPLSSSSNSAGAPRDPVLSSEGGAPPTAPSQRRRGSGAVVFYEPPPPSRPASGGSTLSFAVPTTPNIRVDSARSRSSNSPDHNSTPLSN